jgi:two-component system LytT family sensor kinase
VLKKKYTYLLFFIAYIGAVAIAKPGYPYAVMTVRECFSYLFTVIVHFVLFALMMTTHNRVLIPYLIDKRRFGLYFLGLGSLVSLYAMLAVHYNGFMHTQLLHDKPIDLSAGFWDNLVYALCCSTIATVLYVTQKWAEQQEQMKNSQINQLQTELKYLRAQVNPHFLFNGLNTVYGYIDQTNRAARDMMVQFSDLLRYNLYEADVDLIELDKEIRYLKNYVALQRARSNENVDIQLDIQCQHGGVRIAPLILMAFVENAFKYVSRGDESNRISISLKQGEGLLAFICENTVDEEQHSEAGGIGLSNAERRLELLYKDQYQLSITQSDNLYRVDLNLHV